MNGKEYASIDTPAIHDPVTLYRRDATRVSVPSAREDRVLGERLMETRTLFREAALRHPAILEKTADTYRDLLASGKVGGKVLTRSLSKDPKRPAFSSTVMSGIEHAARAGEAQTEEKRESAVDAAIEEFEVFP